MPDIIASHHGHDGNLVITQSRKWSRGEQPFDSYDSANSNSFPKEVLTSKGPKQVRIRKNYSKIGCQCTFRKNYFYFLQFLPATVRFHFVRRPPRAMRKSQSCLQDMNRPPLPPRHRPRHADPPRLFSGKFRSDTRTSFLSMRPGHSQESLGFIQCM